MTHRPRRLEVHGPVGDIAEERERLADTANAERLEELLGEAFQ